MSAPQIVAESATISTIAFGPKPDDAGYSVGVNGVSLIEPYYENGQMSPVAWFAVYIGSFIIARVPAHMVFVVYQPPGGAQ